MVNKNKPTKNQTKNQTIFSVEEIIKEVSRAENPKNKFYEIVDQLNLTPEQIIDLKEIIKKTDYNIWALIEGYDDDDPYEEYRYEEDYYTPELGYDPCEEEDCDE